MSVGRRRPGGRGGEGRSSEVFHEVDPAILANYLLPKDHGRQTSSVPIMNPPRSLVFLILFSSLRQSVDARSNAAAFFPRGGGLDSIRQSQIGRKRSPTSKLFPESDSANATQLEGGEVHANDNNDESAATFDREAVTKRLHREEVANMKKTQQFLQKQERRREMDKTWLDKGITAVIEFFENLFRWEVIDV